MMKGMKEAVEMLTIARDEGRVVAVFGDYDADGVTASTVMEETLILSGVPRERIEIML